MFVYLTIVFSTACVASGVLTALVCRLAPRVGLTDSPDGHRKIHRGPTPLGGGLAVFVATAAVLSLLLVVPGPLRASLRENWPGLASLLLAGAVVVAVGLIDDLLGAGAKPSRRAGTAGAGASGTAPAPKGLRGRQKLLGQVLAAAIVLAGGLLIERIRILDWQITLGPLAVPFTLFWLLGAINALNLLDGIDGLAATLGLILTSTVAVMAVLIGRPQVALTALVFAGALLGFLRFNFPPARVFLGDAGSMLIGLVVGTLAIQGSLKGPGTVLLAAPLAVWTIPIFDSTAAILRRKLTGRSVYATDRCHLHHRLLDRLGSTASEARDSRRSATIQRKVLGLVAVASTATSAGALVSIFSNHDLIALVTCAGVVVIFVVTDVFGRAECVLLASRLRRIGLSFLAQARSRQAEASETTCRLQGSRQWERPWRALTEAAEKLRLRRIRLDVNHPAAQEAYHATWEQPSKEDLDRHWRMELPLVVADQVVGRLMVLGHHKGQFARHEMNQFLDQLEPFETQLQDLTERGVLPPAPETADRITGSTTSCSSGNPVEERKRAALPREDAPSRSVPVPVHAKQPAGR